MFGTQNFQRKLKIGQKLNYEPKKIPTLCVVTSPYSPLGWGVKYPFYEHHLRVSTKNQII